MSRWRHLSAQANFLPQSVHSRPHAMADDTRVTHPRLGIACVSRSLYALGCALPAARSAGNHREARRRPERRRAGRHPRRRRREARPHAAPAEHRGRRGPARRERRRWRRSTPTRTSVYAVPDAAAGRATRRRPLTTSGGSHNDGTAPARRAGTGDADIDAPEAWEAAPGAGVTVAVVDSGIDPDAP